MIKIENISKCFEHKSGYKHVFKDASCVLPDKGNIAVLGKAGSGKSVLIKMIGNSLFPDSGHIEINEKISWPVGFRGQLLNNQTVRDNIEFVSLLMQASRAKHKQVLDFVVDFSEVGKSIDMPVRTLSKSMKERLEFALCFAFDFETYLMDEFDLEEDSVLRSKAKKFISGERPNSRIIIATNKLKEVKKCQIGLIIRDHKLFLYENINQAVEEYQKMFTNSADAFVE